VVSVFTGETFPPSWVPEDFGSSGGPECASQLVLPVVAGKVYDIGVDGNLFSPPGGSVWSGEGTIHLRIATLPPPPNDDFAVDGSPGTPSARKKSQEAPQAPLCGPPETPQRLLGTGPFRRPRTAATTARGRLSG